MYRRRHGTSHYHRARLIKFRYWPQPAAPRLKHRGLLLNQGLGLVLSRLATSIKLCNSLCFTAQKVRRALRRIFLALCLTQILGGCGEDNEAIKTQGIKALNDWFLASASDNPPSCHGFGLVKFYDASCADMYQHAAKIEPESRTITSSRLLKCFGQGAQELCGEFVEIWLNSMDTGGNPIQEGAVLKRDDGVFRLYWYRSDALFTTLTKRAENTSDDDNERVLEDKQSELEAIYAEIVQRQPALYQFVMCTDASVSSSKLVGKPVHPQDISATDMASRAQRCPEIFCLALVGKRIAPLCD